MLLNSHLLSEVELVCDRVVIIDRGRVVAAGSPASSRRPAGSRSRRRRAFGSIADAGREDVPRIVAELVAAGEQIYGVRVLRSGLEDVYLDAVGERRVVIVVVGYALREAVGGECFVVVLS